MKLFGRSSRPSPPPQAAQSPQETAARWLARSQLGLLRRDEEEEFRRWRAQSENAAALEELTAVLGCVQETASQPEISRMRAEALAHPRRSPALLGNVPVGIAAGVLIALTALLFVWKDEPAAVAPVASAAVESFETLKGERRVVMLSDGSSLTLNTGSRAEVAMTPQKRSVRLVRGQALFQVAADKDRPFSVLAGSVAVTALGTQFDVRLDGGDTKVVLVEGRVRVEPLARRGIAQLLPMIDRHELSPGEQLTAPAEEPISVSTADIERSTSWQHDRLVFRDNTLGEAVAEFNRYSVRQILITDPVVARFPVNGVFSISRPENFIAAVSAFYALSLEERSPQLAVLALRPR